MKVKSKIVARYEDKGRLKAVATVCLDGIPEFQGNQVTVQLTMSFS